ncbi:cytosolic thiouridylase subunit Ctu1 [Lodderomyces elongisporus]|uniref:Cytoplasmic tRNA 2-thiolation protein 1 n=1 Tax=Lodderomyces elongisporus (strain ATCC 11503 / CBS 2605 / JCM 1781 / NBRC 1676 / NRRL YB-4239) TaxID=379508 RepID=CTU1_LODEL|nr:cytosolic thiouridylase subunit Ctu1 [Lodderomyces elongisporus]A5E3Q3.1 RecName: Full=Cytoplasmic tRNA 2-thiolation protein 1; AltName: Full=Cytoplasmic tRNA adenylyltransferase 1 [Lodderomyces elongisporus NRRL YB-4239]EDK46061.1 VEG136 protein [Lodderomyces elongisporus NRRL YB-4239]WLF80192.1 cytosolic thiouridylase subunit Ctu1 [Lodderomyces elongisporus]
MVESSNTKKVKVSSLCELCHGRKAVMKRPKNLRKLCKECFFHVFETEVHNTIVENKLFANVENSEFPERRAVAIGASGGKDSTVLASVMKTLNERYNYGLKLVLLCIDEGIKGYRDHSLETVKMNQKEYDMPLEILSYKDLYDWTMDEVVSCAGIRSSCTYCGVLRRQALDKGAEKLGINHIVTGHNADDMAETVLLNLLRGDINRIENSTKIITDSENSVIQRSKPFAYMSQKEIVLYAHYKNLTYFSTECTYSEEAFRGECRSLFHSLSAVLPSVHTNTIYSGQQFKRKAKAMKRQNNKNNKNNKNNMADEHEVLPNGTVAIKESKRCKKCGSLASNDLCQACFLLAGLEVSRAKVSIDSEGDGAAKLSKTLEGLTF